MDWACLPQKPFANDAEKQRFKLSLDTINAWYFHKATFVLLCTLPPPELPSGETPYTNTRLHSQRGWCHFERAASMVIKNAECLLDLSQYAGATDFGHGGSHTMGARTCCGQMKSARRPPIAPDQFGVSMRELVASGELRFTAQADMEAVIGQYALGFQVAFDGLGNNGTVIAVGYINLSWGDDEGHVVLEALRYAAAHCRFPFGPIPLLLAQGNRFSPEMLAALPATGTVHVRGVRYGSATSSPIGAPEERPPLDASARESIGSLDDDDDMSLRQGVENELSLRQGVETELSLRQGVDTRSLRQGMGLNDDDETTLQSVEPGPSPYGDWQVARALLDGASGTEMRQAAGGIAFVRIN